MPAWSLSHFLGRFRRSNNLTPGVLASAAGFGGVIISRWEKFRFNPPPSAGQLAALAVVVGVEVERLVEMLPPVARASFNHCDSIEYFDSWSRLALAIPTIITNLLPCQQNSFLVESLPR